MTRAQPRKVHAAFRFMHAAARLRTRWGIELTMEEYEEANDRFRKDDGVHGRQVNCRGDIEGWIPIRGKLIPCVFDKRTGVIATFFAPPPAMSVPTVPVPNVRVRQLEAAAHDKDVELRTLRTKVASLEACVQAKTTKIRDLADRLSAAEGRAAVAEHRARTAAQQRPEPEGLKEARWLKARMESIAALLHGGHATAAFLLLDSLVSAPRAFRFAVDEDVTRGMLERRCAERVAHFAKET